MHDPPPSPPTPQQKKNVENRSGSDSCIETHPHLFCLRTWPRSFICSWVTPPSQPYHGNFFLFDAHLQFSRQLCKHSVPEWVIAPVVMVVVGGCFFCFFFGGGGGSGGGERVVSIFYSCSQSVRLLKEVIPAGATHSKDYWNVIIACAS